jgi:hypothetical protein
MNKYKEHHYMLIIPVVLVWSTLVLAAGGASTATYEHDRQAELLALRDEFIGAWSQNLEAQYLACAGTTIDDDQLSQTIAARSPDHSCLAVLQAEMAVMAQAHQDWTQAIRHLDPRLQPPARPGQEPQEE